MLAARERAAGDATRAAIRREAGPAAAGPPAARGPRSVTAAAARPPPPATALPVPAGEPSRRTANEPADTLARLRDAKRRARSDSRRRRRPVRRRQSALAGERRGRDGGRCSGAPASAPSVLRSSGAARARSPASPAALAARRPALVAVLAGRRLLGVHAPDAEADPDRLRRHRRRAGPRRGRRSSTSSPGDAGCDDQRLARTAISFDASGLDQAQPTRVHLYAFKNADGLRRAAADRRPVRPQLRHRPGRLRVGRRDARTCSPGPGPWAPDFEDALRKALERAAVGG